MDEGKDGEGKKAKEQEKGEWKGEGKEKKGVDFAPLQKLLRAPMRVFCLVFAVIITCHSYAVVRDSYGGRRAPVYCMSDTLRYCVEANKNLAIAAHTICREHL